MLASGMKPAPGRLCDRRLLQWMLPSFVDFWPCACRSIRIPHPVVVLDKMPRNRNGKVDRPALQVRKAVAQHHGSLHVRQNSYLNFLPQIKRMPCLAAWAIIVMPRLARNTLSSGGEYLPITSAELELTMVHRWQHGRTLYDNCALEEGERVLAHKQVNIWPTVSPMHFWPIIPQARLSHLFCLMWKQICPLASYSFLQRRRLLPSDRFAKPAACS